MTHGKRITQIAKLSFKTKMIKSSLHDYRDAYIVVKGTITVPSTGAAP